MYDAVNLSVALEQAGFVRVQRRAWNDSDIDTWHAHGLEVAEDGGEYKPRSLYIEARTPPEEPDR
jgi:hypothetical protein